MATITDIQLAAAMRLGDGTSALSEPIASIVTRLNAVGTAYTELFIPNAPDAIQNEAIVRFASYLYDAPSASVDGRFAAAWHNSGAYALAAPFIQLSSSAPAVAVPGGQGPGSVTAGLDTDAVTALIQQLVANWAEEGSILALPLDKIPANQRLPAPAASKWLQWDNTASALINVDAPSGGMGGGGISQSTFNALQARVIDLEAFETALSETTDLFTGNVIVAVSNAGYRVTGNIAWPASGTAGQTVSIEISNRPSSALVHIGTYEFPLSRIYALAAQNPDSQLNDSNAVSFTLGGTRFRLARSTTSNQILFTAEDIDTYTINIDTTTPDLESFARDSSLDLVPLTKLPTIPASKVSGLPTGGQPAPPNNGNSGLTQNQVDTRITTLVLDWARSTDLLIPNNQLPLFFQSLIAANATRSGDLLVAVTDTDPKNTFGFKLGSIPNSHTDNISDLRTSRTNTQEFIDDIETEENLGTALTGTATDTRQPSSGRLGNRPTAWTHSIATTYPTNRPHAELRINVTNTTTTGRVIRHVDIPLANILRLQAYTSGTIVGRNIQAIEAGTAVQSSTDNVITTGNLWQQIGNTGTTGTETNITVGVGRTSTNQIRVWVGRNTSGAAWAYSIQLSIVEPDIQSWARRSSTALIPATKISGLPTITYGTRVLALENFRKQLETRVLGTPDDNQNAFTPVSFSTSTIPWPAAEAGEIYEVEIRASLPGIRDVDMIYGPKTIPADDIAGLTTIPHTTRRPTASTSNAYTVTFEAPVRSDTGAAVAGWHGLTAQFAKSTEPPGNTIAMFRLNPITAMDGNSSRSYRVLVYTDKIDLRPFARRSQPVGHLNNTSARGQATVTNANNSAGVTVPFGAVNQVTEGDIVMIELDPATTTDGNATVITRIPPSNEDTWFNGNQFQSQSAVTDNVQIKITNGTSYVSMTLERGSHSTAPKLINGNYTLRRINLA